MSNNTYNFYSRNGEAPQGSNPIFPIVKHSGAEFELVGTGFFICNFGIFVTARHVLFDVLDEDGNQVHPIGAIHSINENEYLLRPVLRCNSNTVSDITVGVLAPALHNVTGEPLTNSITSLTIEVPTIGSNIVTYAYPESDLTKKSEGKQIANLQPKFYDGKLEDCHPEGRDSVMLPFPCYRGSMPILSGASGGPVFNNVGHVFGVNCSGVDGTDIGYFSRINEIFQLWVDDVMLDGVKRDRVSVKELIDLKQIVFNPPINFS